MKTKRALLNFHEGTVTSFVKIVDHRKLPPIRPQTLHGLVKRDSIMGYSGLMGDED
jgi:hypothetical protein